MRIPKTAGGLKEARLSSSADRQSEIRIPKSEIKRPNIYARTRGVNPHAASIFFRPPKTRCYNPDRFGPGLRRSVARKGLHL
jgi:hypothetical protein